MVGASSLSSLHDLVMCVSKKCICVHTGSLFAMMHCGESITYFLAPFAFSAIYASTLHAYSGLVFIVSFLLLALPVGFTL